MSVAETVNLHVQSKGFRMPNNPGPEPDLPDDLSMLTPTELINAMHHYSALMAFALAEVADNNNKAASHKARYKFFYGKKYLERQETNSKRRAVKSIEYELDCDSELDALRRQVALAEQYAHLVDALYQGYAAKLSVLSRELTRRGMNREN